MKKLYSILILIAFLGVNQQLHAQCNDRPIINDFSPKTGFIGSTVTITGANFSATPSENQVFFGATQAEVVSSTFGTLEVRVPEGSTTALISVKNQCDLTAYSKTHHNGIFCPTPLTATSYQNVAQELTGVAGAYNMISQDMDNDGRPDVISALSGITIAQNNSTPGNINFINRRFNIGSFSSIAIADFDGDGLKDIASNGGIVRNTSTGPGNFGLLRVTDSRAVSSYQIGAGDFNNDGKVDIIGENGGSVWISFNTSTGPGNFNFSARQLVASGIGRCTGIQVVDVDGDGRTDFLASQGQSNRAVSIRNTVANGSFTSSFEAPEYWASDSDPSDGTGTFPYRSMIADFDKDGRMDFTSCNYLSNTNTAIWRNTSTVGDISFAPAVNIPSPRNNYRIGVGDVDGDGYPDIVTKSLGVNVFSVYRNTTTTAGTPSFAPRFDYTSSARAEVSGIAIGDLDGDFVPDIATSGISSNTIRFHRNTGGQNDVTPPTVACRNIVVALDPSGSVTITPEMIDDGSGDACGIESLVLSQTTFTCADIGENTVTLTATDGAGNSSSCTATVNVQPAAIIVAGQSTVCQGETVEMSANQGDSYQWKKDGVDIAGATAQNYTATETGNYTVVVTNAGGCSGESIATPITVNENPTVDISPSGNTFLCPPNGEAVLTASQSAIYQWMLNGVDIPNATQQTYTATAAGDYSVRVIDLFGCSAISDVVGVNANPAEIEVTNNGNNVANAATVISDGFNLDYGNVLPNTSYDTLITIDNISDPVNNAILDVSDVVISGPDAQYLSIADLTFPVGISPGTQGNFALVFNGPDIRTYNATVTILSNDCDESSITINVTAEITCEAAAFSSFPANINANNDPGLCAANINYNIEFVGNPEPTLTYTFSGATNGDGTGTGSGSLFNVGTTTVTVSVENACGNETQSFDIVVEDNVPPVIDAPSDITVNTNNNSCGHTFDTPPSVTASDNCGVNTITGVRSDGLALTDAYPVGETTITWSATDVNGNVSGNGSGGNFINQNFNNPSNFTNDAVLLDFENLNNGDLVSNQYTADGVTFNLTGGFLPQARFDGSSRPFGPNGTMVISNYPPGSFNSANGYPDMVATFDGGVNRVGFEIRTNTADDLNITIQCIKNGVVIGSQTIDTNLAFQFIGIESSQSFDQLVLDVTNVTNGAFNLDNFRFEGGQTVTQTITVVDNEPPTLAFNEITVPLDANGVAAFTAEMIDNGSSDNCGIASITISENSFECGDVGVNSVVFEVTDENGNTNAANVNVTVVDNIPPAAVTQDITVELDANGVAAFTAEMIDNGSSDNCGIASITISENSFECGDVGVNSVVFEVTDTSGNTDAVNVNVTVVDNIPPAAIAQAITVELDANGVAAFTPEMIDNGSFDNCGIANITISENSFECGDVGVNSVVFEVTDTSGNTDAVNVDVTVVDNIAPNVLTQDITVQLDANGEATITPEMIENGSTDICGVANISLDITSFDCSNVGENTVSLTVTDVNGNSSSANATVTVEDTISPTVVTQNISVTLANGLANITAADIDGGTFDNCSFELSIDNNSFDCDDIGDHTVRLTATDASGNTSSSTAIVSVLGDVPEISINDFTTVQSQASNTIYLGFGSQSATLNTVTTGGTGFTYEWTASTGESVASVANPTVSPTVSTTYNVVVTNSNGCTASAEIYVCVIDARAVNKNGQPNGKVLVCHRTSGKKGIKTVLISISPNAVMKHLTNHGDSLGACNAVCVTSETNTAIRTEIAPETHNHNPSMTLYPNPSKGEFTVDLSNFDHDATVEVYTMYGNLIESRSMSISKSKKINLGNRRLKKGTYVVRVKSGKNIFTKLLIIK